ncbi:MAG: energy-coupling factor transporter transmembrane component T [Bacillota bacterium]|nr:energy-coupling factor transporter transmembrane component T [Bacillota bacterium]
MDWLFKEDDYIPQNDKDTFIDRTIGAFLKLLSNIKRANKYVGVKYIYLISPFVKFICTILTIILISTAKSVIFVGIVVTALYIMCFMVNGEDRKKIYTLNMIIPTFTLIMLLPSIILGNFNNSVMIVLKVMGTITSVNILAYTTKWHIITKALKFLFIPDIFIFVMDITIRYIYLLGEFSLDMLYALRLRTVGRNRRKQTSIAQLIGTLFLKSKEMGNEVYSAMECRGFVGEYEVYNKFKFTKRDISYCMIYAIFVILYLGIIYLKL